MGTYYTEFDTTATMAVYDIRQAILGSTDWSRLSTDTVLLTTSASSAAAATSLTFTSTAGSGLAIGSVISIEAPNSSAREIRKITGITATSISVGSLTYAHASGTTIYLAADVVKATTNRGADMILDLADDAHLGWYLPMAAYRSHTGTVGTDRSARLLSWRPNATGMAYTNPLHCIVSAGKDHLFISIEGPRPTEAGALSTTTGSLRNYLMFSDLVPYHAGDSTPVVFSAGNVSAGTQNVNVNSHIGFLTRNYANTASWNPARLGTVCFPSTNHLPTVNMNRSTVGDGNWYLFPYVVSSDTDGIRGRLSSFFFAGYNNSDDVSVPTPPVGSKVTYAGVTYKLLAVDKSYSSSARAMGVFGGSGNDSSTLMYNSVVVAVPCP